MPTWFRNAPMEAQGGETQEELWLVKDGEGEPARTYKVSVRCGKPLDVIALKRDLLTDFNAHVSRVRSVRRGLYESSATERVERCPICESPTLASEFRVDIYGGRYHQCVDCTHCFIIRRLPEAAVGKFYSDNTHFASTYTDARVAQTRVEQVALPKAEWAIEQFRRRYGSSPTSVLDIGAGGGHFVHACRRLGVDAQGIELNESSRDFCRENFGFDLRSADFAKDPESFDGVDLLTFWNTIEHMPQPMEFLKAGHRLLSGRPSLLVVEVPRWNSLSTGIQQGFPETVVRHLDPLSHLHFFTDSSLATAFEASGFAPVAAWYFGMDAYELLTQISHLLPGDSLWVKEEVRHLLPSLQRAVDQSRFCDAIVMAGAPLNS